MPRRGKPKITSKDITTFAQRYMLLYELENVDQMQTTLEELRNQIREKLEERKREGNRQKDTVKIEHFKREIRPFNSITSGGTYLVDIKCEGGFGKFLEVLWHLGVILTQFYSQFFR
jgi:hypothetical protein